MRASKSKWKLPALEDTMLIRVVLVAFVPLLAAALSSRRHQQTSLSNVEAAGRIAPPPLLDVTVLEPASETAASKEDLDGLRSTTNINGVTDPSINRTTSEYEQSKRDLITSGAEDEFLGQPVSTPRTAQGAPASALACQAANRVANRKDNINARDLPVVRPWSVTWGESFPMKPGILRNVAANSRSAPPEDESVWACQNVQSLLRAVRNGERTWPPEPRIPDTDRADARPAASSLQREQVPSIFKPEGCGVPLFTPQRLCSALADYSDVLLVGDSLMRHVRQALKLVSAGDWEHGAWPTRTLPAVEPDKSDCRCDGSFSEVRYCRDGIGTFKLGCAPPVVSYQGTSGNSAQATAKMLSAKRGLRSSDICVGGKKKLVVIEGGVHYRFNPEKTEARELDPVFEQIDRALGTCSKPPELTVVYMAADAQSRRLDGRYPHQAREKAAAFNAQVETYLREKRPGVRILNFWNMTRDAQTSDGFHYLTDVNVAKVYALLRLVELEARAGRKEEGAAGA